MVLTEDVDLEGLFGLEVPCEGMHGDKGSHDDDHAKWRIIVACDLRCSWLVCEGYRRYFIAFEEETIRQGVMTLCPRCNELAEPGEALFIEI